MFSLFKKLTMRHVLILLVVIITGGAAIAGLMQFSAIPVSSAADDESQNSIRPLPVNVLSLQRVDSVQQRRSFTGTVRSLHQTEVGFELAGKLVSVAVSAGARVSQNQPLAQLDTQTLSAQRNAMLAAIEQANQVLNELKTGARTETLNAARANRDALKSQLELAETFFQRRQQLHRQKAISKDEFDQAEQRLKTAKANWQAAQERVTELETGTRTEKIAAQSAQIKQLQARLEELDVAIAKSTLTAPFAGTVTRKYLDPGSVVEPGKPVLRLVDQQHLEAWIGLPVSLASELGLSSEHQLSIGNRAYPAILSACIQELDAATRTQSVVFRLQNPDGDPIVPGQLCTLQLEQDVEVSGFWVPTSALSKGIRGLWSVLLVQQNQGDQQWRTEKRDVEVIYTQTDRVLVKGALQSGDLIVADGLHRITNGQQVELNQ